MFVRSNHGGDFVPRWRILGRQASYVDNESDMNAMHDPHIGELDLDQLALLEAIHRTASVSAAALEVGLSQPAASHALARMRRLLGDELFVRTSKGMVATWYGKKASTAVVGVLRTLREGLSTEKE